LPSRVLVSAIVRKGARLAFVAGAVVAVMNQPSSGSVVPRSDESSDSRARP